MNLMIARLIEFVLRSLLSHSFFTGAAMQNGSALESEDRDGVYPLKLHIDIFTGGQSQKLPNQDVCFR